MTKNLRGLDYVRAIINDPDFQNSIELFRKSNEFTKVNAPFFILNYHKIPSRYSAVIAHYLHTGDLDETLIHEPVELGTGRSGKGVSLLLSFDITQPELRNYIDKHWASDIKPALEGKSDKRKRLTVARFPDRDKRVYNDFLNKNITGRTNQTIADKYGIDVRTVSRIVARIKNNRT